MGDDAGGMDKRRTMTDRTGTGSAGPARPAPPGLGAGPARPASAGPGAGPDRGPMLGQVAPVVENGLARRTRRTGPGPGSGPDQPRRRGLCVRYSLLIAGYIRPLPPTSQPVRSWPGPADGDRAGPDTPDHKTAPAQDSTHTRTGANQDRARGRRYSLGLPRRLRVRERRIFLGMKNFFRLPPR